MNAETALTLRILADVGSGPTHRLWRNARGLYYAGRIVARGPKTYRLQHGDAVLRGCTPVQAGLCDGAADLVGIVAVPVSLLPPDGVVGLFAGLELKTEDGTVKQHQRAWLEVIRSLGGIADVARSVEEAREIIERGRR